MQAVNDPARGKWELDLNIEILKLVLEKLFNYKVSLNIALKENRYKLLHRWYLTPLQLKKIYPESNHVCWKS